MLFASGLFISQTFFRDASAYGKLGSEVHMSKTLTPDLTAREEPDYEQAVQQMFGEMALSNEKMNRDQEEIERLKVETGEILARLNAA